MGTTMPKYAILAALVASAIFSTSASGQFARVISDKRTIDIHATEKVSVPAEVATVKVGYQNEAASKDAAFNDNKKISSQIVNALLDAKVPKDAIETESFSLQRKEEFNGAASKKPPTFVAAQEWQIHVKASDAQKIIDIAVSAGSNDVGGVDWSVSDPSALEAKANAAALQRARTIAESTASQSGVKLGEILSISNSPDQQLQTVEVEAAPAPKLAADSVTSTPLSLFPPTIEREASVDVVFAINQ
jgi:uncharacterized protein